MTEDERPFTKVGFWKCQEIGNTPRRSESKSEQERTRDCGTATKEGVEIEG
jgi:hypothetical protein